MDDLPPILRNTTRRVRIYVPANEQYGVAVFSDELQKRLVACGSDAVIVRVGLIRALREVNSDRRKGQISVLNLKYGALSWLNRRSIFVLHGFPNLADYSFFGVLLIAVATRLFARTAGVVVSNSEITASVNSKLFGVAVSAIWNPLRSWRSFDQLPRESRDGPSRMSDREKVILFCGRAIPGKRVYEAVCAFLEADGLNNWQFYIAGPIEDARIAHLEKKCPRVKAFGAIPHEKVQHLMRNSAIFITLNELEPYGLVIQEAALAGMNIVCAASSGAARELLRLGYPAMFLVELSTVESVKQQLESAVHYFETSTI